MSTFNAGERARIIAVEAAIRAAMTEGITDLTDGALMTPEQYTPESPVVNGVALVPKAPTMPRDSNRALAAGVVALAQLPVQLPSYTTFNIPNAREHAGCVAYVSNGAAGSPILAFSNGSQWLRVDTATAVSPV